MIKLRPLRTGTNTPTARLLDQALAAAIARTTEKLTASRPTPGIDPPSPPTIATIRTTP